MPNSPHASRPAEAAVHQQARSGARRHVQRRPASRAAGVLDRGLNTRLVGWTFIVVLFVAWEAGVRSKLVSSPAIPSVSAILLEWERVIRSGLLASELLVTLKHMAAGYAIAAIAGVTVGVLIGRFKRAWALFEPVIELLRPIPISAIVPLLILFLGIDDALKITAVFLAALFPVVLNTYAGITSVPRTMRETGDTFGLSRFQAVTEILIPSAAPAIFVGLRSALALALIVAVLGEMIAGSDGMGYLVVQSQQVMNATRLYVGVFTLALLGYGLNLLFLLVEKAVLPWHAGARRQGR